jgi:aminopeptidase YwaD
MKISVTNLTKSSLLIALVLMGAYSGFSQDSTYARSVVNTLASPAFKGRGYVQDGAGKASAYIAAEFRKSGLVPLNNGSYFQEFKLPVNTFPGKVEVKLDNQRLVTAVDYLVDASSPSVHGTFPVVSVGKTALNDPGQMGTILRAAANSFILVDMRPIEGEHREDKQSAESNLQKLLADESSSFKGLIVLSTDKLTWTTLTYQSRRALITVNKKGLDPKTVRSITINLDATFLPEYSTRNVAAQIKGTANTDSTLIVTAHFDHLGMLGSRVYFPGANDNASGVAMMLSLARYYAQHPPKYNMVFLGFSGEEIGILGSRYFVEHPLTDLSKIKFLVNFDLAGTGDEGIRVVNGSIFKDSFDALTQINQQYGLLPKVDIRGAACNSDHCRFYTLGIPCFFIYTQGGIQAYHDVYDRPETLPLTEFQDYFTLMVKFFDGI